MRYKNIDLLRILAMMCVVMHHFVIGEFGLKSMLAEATMQSGNLQTYILIAIDAFVIMGVNIFFLLSGWCRINFKVSKLLKFVFKIYIVFAVVQVIGFITGYVELNISTIKNILDPFDYYWFIMVYVLLMLTSPLLNLIVDNMNFGQFKYCLFIFFAVFCGYGFLFDHNLNINNGYSYLMATALYITGGGIRRFKDELSKWIEGRRGFAIFLSAWAINAVLACLLVKLGKREYAWHMFSYNNPFIALQAIALVGVFGGLKCKLPENKLLDSMAKSTITVYMLHCTCWLATVRNIPIDYMYNKFGFAITLAASVIYAVLIYVVLTGVDRFYEKTVGTCINKVVIHFANKYS